MVKGFMIAGILVILFFLYCCCRAASEADRWLMEHPPEREQKEDAGDGAG